MGKILFKSPSPVGSPYLSLSRHAGSRLEVLARGRFPLSLALLRTFKPLALLVRLALFRFRLSLRARLEG